jgi:Uma2 family endonuclease
MATVQLELGPADHGRELDLGEYEAADYEPGYKYEIVDGRLYVSLRQTFAEHALERWLDRKLSRYAADHPEVINYVAVKSRVFVHKRQKATVPEPDLAAYQGLDLTQDLRDIHWRDLGPVLVAEVLVEGDEYKDLERNVGLYLDVPSVKEYWVLDGRDDPNRPSLVQHRRYGGRWVVRTHPAGSTFATKLLPGFALVLDPRA